MASVVGSTTESLSKLEINGDLISSVPNLHKNLCVLSPDQVDDPVIKLFGGVLLYFFVG